MSDFRLLTYHLGSLFKCILQGPTPGDSDSVSLAHGPGTCILTGNSDVGGPGTILGETLFVSLGRLLDSPKETESFPVFPAERKGACLPTVICLRMWVCEVCAVLGQRLRLLGPQTQPPQCAWDGWRFGSGGFGTRQAFYLLSQKVPRSTSDC